MFSDLRQTLQTLCAVDEPLVRQTRPVSGYLQVAAQVRQLHLQARAAGRRVPLLLFEQVDDSPAEILFNLLADEERLMRLCRRPSGQLLADNLRASGQSWQAFSRHLATRPLETASGCSAALAGYSSATSLAVLPQLHYWPQDSGPYLSLACLYCPLAPHDDQLNGGVYRLRQLDDQHLSLHLNPGSQTARCLERYNRAGQPMPVTICWGTAPAQLLAAVFPLAEGGGTLALAQWLTGAAPRLLKLPGGMRVPADSEVIISGWVDGRRHIDEGRFANHSGFYVAGGSCPLITIDQVWLRPRPLLPATLVGPPPTENQHLGRFLWRHLGVLLANELPFVCQLDCPAELAFHAAVVVQVRAPGKPRQWQEMKQQLLQHPLLQRARILVLVGEETSCERPTDVLWRLAQQLPTAVQSQAGRLLCDAVAWRYQGRCLVCDSELLCHETGMAGAGR